MSIKQVRVCDLCGYREDIVPGEPIGTIGTLKLEVKQTTEMDVCPECEKTLLSIIRKMQKDSDKS